jgi:hypothetical protein
LAIPVRADPRFAPELRAGERLVEADRDDAFVDELPDLDRPPTPRPDEALLPPEERPEPLREVDARAALAREPAVADDLPLPMDERPLDERPPDDFFADDLRAEDFPPEDFRPDDFFFADDLPRDDAPPLPLLPRDEPLDLAFAIEPPSCVSRRVDCRFYHRSRQNGNISQKPAHFGISQVQLAGATRGETCSAPGRPRCRIEWLPGPHTPARAGVEVPGDR